MPFLFRQFKPGKTAEASEPPGLTPERLDGVLVEIQGREAALEVLRRCRAGVAIGARIYAGPRETGACALACARHLVNWDVPCLVYMVGGRDRARGQGQLQLAIWQRLGGQLVDVLNEEQALGSILTFDANELAVDGVGETVALGEEAGKVEAIHRAIVPALAARQLAAVTVRFDRKFRPPAPSASDPAIEVKAGPVTREVARLYDSVAIERYGIPGLLLMENAGYRAAREAYLMLDAPGEQLAVVLCGKGNNGGDGFAICRYLAWWGVDVRCYLLGEPRQVLDDALANMDMLDLVGLRPRPISAPENAAALREDIAGAGLIVDAILGTGLTRPLRDDVLALVRTVNASGKPVLAVDTPTGLDCNSGEALGEVIRATRTVTFAAPKVGFFCGAGSQAVGELVVADISLPAAITADGGP